MVSTVHVVFKTHLDLGFTDTAARVTDAYVHAYLPRALKLAAELDRRGGPARFVWTTGSWLIQEALRLGTPAEVDALVAGIESGAIAWHALPLTTHTELLDVGMAEHAVLIGRKLDARFGRTTTAAKMTDVPGHTLGLVPVLAAAGITFLHLGVNAASAVPEVPEFFRWRSPDGAEVVVCYARSYGATELGLAIAPGGEHALHLAHTGDNHGPPSAADVEELFAALAAAHPGARIVASTLEAFGAAVVADAGALPVVTAEIGDSWIHGAGTDPAQTAHLRALERLRAAWVRAGALVPGTAECDDFSDGLLLVAEHTWGKDLKTWLPDYAHYTKPAFRAARAADAVDVAANPPGLEEFVWAKETARYADFEASWDEQRGHVRRALAALEPGRRALAEAELAASEPAWPDGGTPVDPATEIALGGFRLRLGADGALVALVDAAGVDHAGAGLAGYRYQTFDERDEALWLAQYCRDLDETGTWAIPDQSKPGLAIAGTLPARVFIPEVTGAVVVGAELRVDLALPPEAAEHWGAPRRTRLTYRAVPGGLEITLDVADRDASRLPEASWLTFRPGGSGWRLRKLGTLVDPLDGVPGGNRRLHAVEAVQRDGFVLRPLDAPLVSVGEPALYRFPRTAPNLDGGFHVNLHNTMWGTNFPMWTEDDRRYRFALDLGAAVGRGVGGAA